MSVYGGCQKIPASCAWNQLSAQQLWSGILVGVRWLQEGVGHPSHSFIGELLPNFTGSSHPQCSRYDFSKFLAEYEACHMDYVRMRFREARLDLPTQLLFGAAMVVWRSGLGCPL